MLGIMEDLPVPHQALSGAGEVPTKTKAAKVKKVPNNGSTIMDFFKTPPKPAVPKPVNLFGYFPQKSPPPSSDQISRGKPSDHSTKTDTVGKSTDVGKESPKTAKSQGREQKMKKKKKSDLKEESERETADINKDDSGECDVKSYQKKKNPKEKSSKGKRKKAASPESSTDDFESPVKAKRPKIANKKTGVSKKVFSLSLGDDDSSVVEASYNVATVDEEEEARQVSSEGKDASGSSGTNENSVPSEEMEVVKDDDMIQKSSDKVSESDLKTVKSNEVEDEKVEVISYEDFLNSGLEDLEESETEKDKNTLRGRADGGTADSEESDVLVLESSGEDGVRIITPGKTREDDSHKEEMSPGISVVGKKEVEEETVDATDDIKPLDEEVATSGNETEDIKNEPNSGKDGEGDGHRKDEKQEGNDTNDSKEDVTTTETPSKGGPTVVDQSPKVVTVEAIIHSPESGQLCEKMASREANNPVSGRISNVALDDKDNDISIIKVVNSPVKPLYSIFLKKPKGVKTSGETGETKESKDADEESDAFDETPAKKKGKRKEKKQESAKKERPRRTPKRKSAGDEDGVKKPSPAKTDTPKSKRKAKTKGKGISESKKRDAVVKKSKGGKEDISDASGSSEMGRRTLRSRRSIVKMKELSSEEDEEEAGGGGGGKRRGMKNNSKDSTERKEKKLRRDPKELLINSNKSKNTQKKKNQSAKAQLLLKKAKGQTLLASQGQRLQERTKKPTLRTKLEPQAVSLKPVKVVDLDLERKKDHMGVDESSEKRTVIKGSGKASNKASAKIAPMFTKEGLKSLAKKQQQETVGDVVEIHTLSSDDEYSKPNESVNPVASPFTVLAASKKWKEKTERNDLPAPSFPKISHVQQRGNSSTGVDFWNLPHVEPSKLNISKDFQSQCITSVLKGMSQPLGRITMSHIQGFVMPPIEFGKHPELTHESQKAALEEISKCNPKFPVRRIFKRYLAKRKGEKPEELKKKDEKSGSSKLEQTSRKRKPEHQNDGSERKVRRRSLRGRSVKEQPKTADAEVTVIEKTEDETSDSFRPQDLLWADKYQPTSSEEVLGNTASVKKLAGWLSEWKTKIHKLKKKEAKAQKGSSGEPKEDSESDFEPSDEGGSDSEDDGDGLCNTILITGPHGVGKTSMVHACAKEMGFKVIEVNASSKRVGRQILDDLGEATQSHQLTGQAGVKSANLAQFFKVKSPSALSSKPQPIPPKPKIHKAFAAFVKAGAKKSDSSGNVKSPQLKKTSPQKTTAKRPAKKATPKKATPKKGSPKKVQGSPKKTGAKMKSPANGKKTSKLTKIAAPDKSKSGVSGASLILFDEVDIVFEEDKGFLNAVNTFMAGAKRPIILTTSDAHFGDHLEGKFEHVVLRRPDTPRLATNMQLLCLAENVNTNYQDMANLVSYCGNDVRQCLHNLQFWLNSGAMLSSWQRKVETSPSLKVCKLSLKRLKEGEEYSCSVKSESANVESNKKASIGRSEQTVLPKVHKESFLSMMGCDTFEQLGVLFKSQHSETAATQNVLPYTLIRKFMREGANHVRQLEGDILDKIVEDYPPAPSSQSTVKADSGETGGDKGRIKKLCATSLDHCNSYLENLCVLDILEQKTNLQNSDATQDHDGRWWGAEVSASLGDISDGRMSNWRREELCDDLRSVLEWENFRMCRKNLIKVGKEWRAVEESQTESSDTGPEGTCGNAEVKPEPPSELLRVDVSASDIILLYGVISRKLPRWTRCRPHVISLDYLPSIRLMCRSEQMREAAHLKRRFLHYFDSISFNLKKTDQVQLASITENFTKRVMAQDEVELPENESDSD